MHQLTLISLYGEKPKPFRDLVSKVWEAINRSRLGRFFRPYDMRQIHGTLIGMERVPGHVTPYNLNIYQSTKALTPMAFDGLPRVVCDHLPMDFQFGGFQQDYDGFLSFGKTPYVRSFQVQWATRKVTIIGWPFKSTESGRSFADRRLLNLRNNLKQQCNIEHKYSPPKHEDNDLFMVLGELVDLQKATEDEMSRLKGAVTTEFEHEVRDFLATNPIEVTVSRPQVFVARYTKETLPLDSTDVYCLNDLAANAPFIPTLY